MRCSVPRRPSSPGVRCRGRSEWGTTTSRIFLPSVPTTSRVLVGCRWDPSSCIWCPPVCRLAGAFAHSVELYSTRVMAPRRTDSTASRSGSSFGRSSLRGHQAPSTCPVGGALGFNRSRGVCSGPCSRRPGSARPPCNVIPTSRLGLIERPIMRIGDDTISNGRVRHTADNTDSTTRTSRGFYAIAGSRRTSLRRGRVRKPTNDVKGRCERRLHTWRWSAGHA